MRIVYIYSHPNPEKSTANKAIFNEMKNTLDAEFVNLSELYTFNNIDVSAEQERLRSADLIVFQFPLWFGNVTPLLLQYIIKVFTAGFAFRMNAPGDLVGKQISLVITAGNPEAAYAENGTKPYSPSEDMTWMKSTCDFIRARELDVNVFYDAHNVTEERVVEFCEKFSSKLG